MEMIIKMLTRQVSPAKIESKLEKALDTEAAMLVKRIWRMLVFEYLKLTSSK